MNNLDPVDINSISTKHDTEKTSAMLLIKCGAELLLQKIEHQKAIIYDAFGTFVESTDTAKAQIMKVQDENFASSFRVEFVGKVLAYIDKPKPDGRVQLTTFIYQIELDQEKASKLKFKDSYVWLNAKDIQNNDLIREDDKIIFTFALSNQDLNIVVDVDQHGQWIDARLLAWARLTT